MRLLASYSLGLGIETEVTHALLEDINKIPTFQIVKPPSFYHNANKVRLIVDDSMNIVALVSSEYKLSQPKVMARNLVMALPFSIHSYQIWYYKGKVWLKCVFNNENYSKAGDFKVGILYEDSVDRSLLLKIIYAPRIKSCGNDIYFSKCRLTARHVSTLLTNVNAFMKTLEQFIFNPNFINNAYDRMSKEEVTLERFNDIMNKLYLPKKYTVKVRWVNDMSLWDLYMKLTNILTVSKAPLQYHLQVAKLVEI